MVSSQTEAVVSKTLMKSNASVLAFTTDLSRWYRMLFYEGLGSTGLTISLDIHHVLIHS